MELLDLSSTHRIDSSTQKVERRDDIPPVSHRAGTVGWIESPQRPSTAQCQCGVNASFGHIQPVSHECAKGIVALTTPSVGSLSLRAKVGLHRVAYAIDGAAQDKTPQEHAAALRHHDMLRNNKCCLKVCLNSMHLNRTERCWSTIGNCADAKRGLTSLYPHHLSSNRTSIIVVLKALASCGFEAVWDQTKHRTDAAWKRGGSSSNVLGIVQAVGSTTSSLWRSTAVFPAALVGDITLPHHTNMSATTTTVDPVHL
eukprot:1050845-Amphidinium_carterae.1